MIGVIVLIVYVAQKSSEIRFSKELQRGRTAQELRRASMTQQERDLEDYEARRRRESAEMRRGLRETPEYFDENGIPHNSFGTRLPRNTDK